MTNTRNRQSTIKWTEIKTESKQGRMTDWVPGRRLTHLTYPYYWVTQFKSNEFELDTTHILIMSENWTHESYLCTANKFIRISTLELNWVSNNKQSRWPGNVTRNWLRFLPLFQVRWPSFDKTNRCLLIRRNRLRKWRRIKTSLVVVMLLLRVMTYVVFL